MLKEILSVTGKPGLFKLVSQGKNMLIVESLIDGKRIPAYTKDKVVSLGDIAIFTETEEVPLGKVLEKSRPKRTERFVRLMPNQITIFYGNIWPKFYLNTIGNGFIQVIYVN